MSYHFSKDKPEDQLVSDIGNAAKFGDEMFQAFIELIFSLLTQSKQASRMMTEIQTFGSTHGINEDALRGVVRGWMTFFAAAQRGNLTPQFVAQDLVLTGLSEDRARAVAKVYKHNLVALSRAVAGRTLVVNQLTNMEWKFGVTAGSSEVRSSGATFLQLKLTLANGADQDQVFMELSLPQFYSFLQEMEKARASLDYLS